MKFIGGATSFYGNTNIACVATTFNKLLAARTYSHGVLSWDNVMAEISPLSVRQFSLSKDNKWEQPGWRIEQRYRKGVLVGNWSEDRHDKVFVIIIKFYYYYNNNNYYNTCLKLLCNLCSMIIM